MSQRLQRRSGTAVQQWLQEYVQRVVRKARVKSFSGLVVLRQQGPRQTVNRRTRSSASSGSAHCRRSLSF